MGLKELFGKPRKKETREIDDVDLETMAAYMEVRFGMRAARPEEIPEEEAESEEIIEFQKRKER